MPSLIKLIKQTLKMTHSMERRVVMDNIAALSVLQIITYLLPLFIIPYLFRVLGAKKFGLIAFAQAFVQYFIIMTNYGFNISATKEISLFRNNLDKISKTFSSVMIIKTTLTFLSLLLLSALVYFIPKFRNDWLVYVLSFGTVAGSALFPVWFFQGMEKMKYITNLNIFVGGLSALFIFSFVRSPQDYLWVPLINSASSLMIGLWGQSIVLRKFQISFKIPGYQHIREQLTAGWNIFISVAAINAYTTARVFILGLLTNNNITGFYSIAERIANACQTFPLDSLSQAIFPHLSKIFQRDHAKARRLMQQLQHITIITFLIYLPLVFIAADGLVKIICGGNYPEVILSLRLLLISVFFVGANAFRVQFLLVCGETTIYSRIHIVMALLGVPLIFFLTSLYSYVGAATATIIIEAGVFTISYLTVKKISSAYK